MREYYTNIYVFADVDVLTTTGQIYYITSAKTMVVKTTLASKRAPHEYSTTSPLFMP
jgi:hypothetical protein